MLREGDAQQRGLGRGTAKGKDKLQTVTETLRVGSTGGETACKLMKRVRTHTRTQHCLTHRECSTSHHCWRLFLSYKTR